MRLPAFFLFSTYFVFSALWGNGDWFGVAKNAFFILVLMAAVELNADRLRQEFVADFWIVAGGTAALIYGVMFLLSPEKAECHYEMKECLPGVADYCGRILLCWRFTFGTFVNWASSNPIDNANVLGLPVIAAWHVFPDKSSLRVRAILLLVMAICLALMCTTFSRGPFLSLCIVIVAMAMVRRRREDIVLLAFFFCVGGVAAMHWNFAQRLASNNYRIGIWAVVFEQIRENWLFGSGFGVNANIIPLGHIHVPVSHSHNSFLEILRQGGIVGSVLFLFMIFCSPLRAYFTRERRFFLSWFFYGTLCLSSNGRFLITHIGRIEILAFWVPLFLLLSAPSAKGPGSPVNPWEEKARALDKYRFALFRQKHGFLGSVLRFVRDCIRDGFFGFLARFCLAKTVSVEPCDFLLLQASPKVIDLQRKKLLKQALRERGHALTETALPEAWDILRSHQLKCPPHPLPLRYFLFAAHAEWLSERYAPKILLNDRNGSLYSPFLRLSLKRSAGRLVQLAHATTLEDSSRLSMNDYDYYFLFGKSSLEALRARSVLLGESRAVFAGSHMIDDAYALEPANEQKSTVLILGVGPDKEKETAYQRTYTLLREWLATRPKIHAIVKAHPRSQVPFWRDAALALPNLVVLPAERTLAQALDQAGIVVNIMSNAVIEAALAHRPIMYVNLSGDEDIFQQERFFGPVIQDIRALDRVFFNILKNYPESIERNAEFAAFHLDSGADGLHRTLELLEALLNGGDIPFQPLGGSGFAP
jgi:hypothetical protein